MSHAGSDRLHWCYKDVTRGVSTSKPHVVGVNRRTSRVVSVNVVTFFGFIFGFIWLNFVSFGFVWLHFVIISFHLNLDLDLCTVLVQSKV